MDQVVVDASIAVAWVHPSQATAQTDALLEQVGQGMRVVVPALWPVEVANVLLVLERRKKLTARERGLALTALRSLRCLVDHEMSPLALHGVVEAGERPDAKCVRRGLPRTGPAPRAPIGLQGRTSP